MPLVRDRLLSQFTDRVVGIDGPTLSEVKTVAVKLSVSSVGEKRRYEDRIALISKDSKDVFPLETSLFFNVDMGRQKDQGA